MAPCVINTGRYYELNEINIILDDSMLIARRIGNTQKTVILELVVHVKAVV